MKCLTAPHSVKFNSIQCLASILSGLSHFYDDVAIEVLDNVLDDIRIGLEVRIIDQCFASSSSSSSLR
jgi:hypothetical protein